MSNRSFVEKPNIEKYFELRWKGIRRGIHSLSSIYKAIYVQQTCVYNGRSLKIAVSDQNSKKTN